jgi:hypothetical protein
MIPAAPAQPTPIGLSWNEVQTPEGRVYYHNSATGVSQWGKPDELCSSGEKAVKDTHWKEYKIWDGRSYFVNDLTKCSVWSTPPEVSMIQNESMDMGSSESIQKTLLDRRLEFQTLLEEKGVNLNTTFTEAMDLIKDDLRYHALPSNEARQLFFANYITSLSRKAVQSQRDARKALYADAIRSLQSWQDMSDAATFSQMEKLFHSTPWFTQLGPLESRKLFDLFSREYIEVEKLKRQRLQDSFMQQLKSDLLENSRIDFTHDDIMAHVNEVYRDSTAPFWTGLSDAQKLVVIKSCLTQRLREVKTELMKQAI